MKITDAQIIFILKTSKDILDKLKLEGFRGKPKEEEFLIELKRQLKSTNNGWSLNVCPKCLGTGEHQ